MYKKEKVSAIRLFLFLLMGEEYEENKTKKNLYFNFNYYGYSKCYKRVS